MLHYPAKSKKQAHNQLALQAASQNAARAAAAANAAIGTTIGTTIGSPAISSPGSPQASTLPSSSSFNAHTNDSGMSFPTALGASGAALASSSPHSTSNPNPHPHTHHQASLPSNAPITAVSCDQLVPPAAAALGSIPLSAILQRLPGVVYLSFLVLLFLGPAYTPVLFSAVYLALHGFFIVNNFRMAYSARLAYYAAREHSTTDWAEKYCTTTGAASSADPSRELPFDDVIHVIVVPNYKENMDTLCETLDILASHAQALTQYKVCLAMEATEKESEQKALELLRQYQDQFFELAYTIHPANLPGEIRGKSSNVAWAAREMARRSPPSCRTREILTVMDADTAFAQDYFSCIAYHYTVASAEQRKIMMFAPSTVFDRNANDVPIFVRMADMVWSAGVLANLYPTSPIKVPCSAYSLSMDLAVAVGFWDTDPTSIGEDMHMYLKCFYATEGRVIVNPIYSPASQCNIQGDSWFETFKQRYTQSKRHMWGSLDAGYIIRRALFAFFAPGYDAPGGQLQEVPLIRPAATRGSQEIQMSLSKVAHLFHRIFEANMILGQVFVLIFITSLILPVENSPSPFAESYWSLITTEAVHPYVAAAASLGGYIRMVATVPFLTMIFFYEKYVFWVGTERWIWSLREQVRPGSGLRVQPLGKRSQLASTRSIFNLIDWVALPVCGLIYLAMPQIHAQCLQLFTDRLDYAVASKPAVAGKTLPASSAPESETLMTRDSDLTTVTVHAASPSAGSTSAAAAAAHNLRPSISNSSSLSAESDKSAASSRGDSGFFEFDDSSIPAGAPVSPSMFSPSMWRQHTKARSTLSSEWSDADSNHELSPSASMDFALPPADAPAVMTL